MASSSNKSTDKSSSSDSSSSSDKSSLKSVSSLSASIGCFAEFSFAGVGSPLRRLRNSTTTVIINIAGNVAIKTINHKLENILLFSNSACCFSNNSSCSRACALASRACCNLIISSICSLISLLFATSFCMVSSWLLNVDNL